MSAGAFTDGKVITATQKLIAISVDCSAKGSNAELKQQYNVQGYPTVLFLDPDGKPVGELGSRSATDVAKQIDTIAAAHTKKAS